MQNEKPFYSEFINKCKKSNTLKDQNIKKIKEQKNIVKSHSYSLIKEKVSVFKELTKEEYDILNSFLSFIEPVLRLNKKQKGQMIKNVRILFEELTLDRKSKNVDYLSDPTRLSAYIYYYLWWNLYRLVRLFNALKIDIKDGDVVGDFGCGPLTIMMALWISKPHFREKNITFYCVDISSKVIKLGEELFYSLCAFTSGNFNDFKKESVKWRIKKVVGSFGVPINERLDFLVCANLFNEIYWNKIENINIEAKKHSSVMEHYLKDNTGFILLVEPGLPIGGKIVSSFRTAFLEHDFNVLSPCPHYSICPIHGKSFNGYNVAKNKWCHFSFTTTHCPSNLLQFSKNVKLSKKTASLSYLYCSKEKGLLEKDKGVIITSNMITLPNGKVGFYACSSKGFLLLQFDEKKSLIKNLTNGSYINLELSKINASFKDRKSGAIIVEL